MTAIAFPFLDLFHALRDEGMKLAPEQYELLRRSLEKGFGLEGWDDLREICRVLWVKPTANDEASVFERVFERYVQQKQQAIRDLQPKETDSPPPSKQSPLSARRLPNIPSRRMPVSQAEPAQIEAPIAVQTGAASLPEVDATGFHLTPRQLPLLTRSLVDSWQFLRRPLRHGLEEELDVEGTIAAIMQQGYFSDVVMRPVQSKKAELVLLVDDSNGLLPFSPALQPLTDAIEAKRIAPAKIYRFTTYPDDYLYDWKHPSQAVSLSSVLAQMHPQHTIGMVWCDAGALSRTRDIEQRNGLLQFLVRLSPCLRELIWLNPLPSQRWRGTLAYELAQLLDGCMIHPDATQLLALAKQPTITNRFYLYPVG